MSWERPSRTGAAGGRGQVGTRTRTGPPPGRLEAQHVRRKAVFRHPVTHVRRQTWADNVSRSMVVRTDLIDRIALPPRQ